MPTVPIGLLARLVLGFLVVSGDPQRIGPGAEVRGSLSKGASVEYELAGPTSGRVTLEICSFDFVAVLEASNDKGRIAITPNSEEDTDEIATFERSAGESTRLSVRAADDGSGEFVLRVLEKPTPPAERLKRRVEGLEERARAALELGDPASAAGFFGRAGLLCQRSGALLDAQVHCERQVQAAARSGDRPSIARAYVRLGSIECALGDLHGALESFAKAEADEGALKPKERLELLQRLGTVHFDLGERDLGLEHLARAEDLARELGGKEDLAVTLATHAHRLVEARRLSEAGGLIAEASRLAEESGRPRILVEVLHAKARWLQGGSRWNDALRICEEALELEPTPTTRFLILGTMAALKETLDDLQGAYRLGQESQTLCESLGVRGYDDEYLLLFGNICLKGSDPARARELLEKALAIQIERNEPEKQVETLLSLASACFAAADQDGARRASEKAVEIAARLGVGRAECRASYLLGRAVQESNPQQSETRLLHAIDLSRQLGEIDLEADALGTLAWGQHLWGREHEAIEQALEAARLYGDLDKCLQALEVLDTQVVSALGCGELDLASDGIEESLARFERTAIEAPEQPGFSVFDYVLAGFGRHAQDWVAKSLAAQDAAPSKDAADQQRRDRARHRTIERGLRLAGMFKCRDLLRSIAINRRGEMADDERALRSRLEESKANWEAKLATRVQLLQCRPSPIEMAAIVDGLETARKLHDGLRDELARIVRESLRDSVPPQAALQELQQVLSPDGLLVEYVTGDKQLYAYAVGSGEPRFQALGSAAEWQQRVQEFVVGLCGEGAPALGRGPSEQHQMMSQGELRARGEQLYAGLLAPILETSGQTPRELVIVPSGFLCTLPFDALTVPRPAAARAPDPSVRPHYLVEESTIAYAPSTPVLLELAKLAERRKPTWPPTALMMADPEYAGETTTKELSSASEGGERRRPNPDPFATLPRLESSRDEVCSLAGRLRSLRSDATPLDAEAILRIQQGRARGSADSWVVPGAELYVGATVTRERFLERSEAFSLLHIAAHAFADENEASEGCLVLSWDPRTKGRVTARDILARGLTADLTVLAACETAIGRDAPHEGVLSISRAFLHAGSRAVVASLWSSNDLQTSQLMQEFYEQYLDHQKPTAIALREAKLRMLHASGVRGVPPTARAPTEERKFDSADPYYWAPYVYFGLPK